MWIIQRCVSKPNHITLKYHHFGSFICNKTVYVQYMETLLHILDIFINVLNDSQFVCLWLMLMGWLTKNICWCSLTYITGTYIFRTSITIVCKGMWEYVTSSSITGRNRTYIRYTILAFLIGRKIQKICLGNQKYLQNCNTHITAIQVNEYGMQVVLHLLNPV